MKQQSPEAPPKKPRGKAIPNTLPIDRRYRLRPDEYAASIGISRRVVDGWMKKNVIPFSKIGRIILIDPVKANAAIDELERKAAQRVKVGGDL